MDAHPEACTPKEPTMSTIETLRKWLRTLVPGLVAPLPAVRLGERRLAAGESVHYDDARGRTLCCLAGRLWITHDHDRRDVVVDAGESYYVVSRQHMIVHALRDGTLRVG
jgi:hypothetical protein